MLHAQILFNTLSYYNKCIYVIHINIIISKCSCTIIAKGWFDVKSSVSTTHKMIICRFGTRNREGCKFEYYIRRACTRPPRLSLRYTWCYQLGTYYVCIYYIRILYYIIRTHHNFTTDRTVVAVCDKREQSSFMRVSYYNYFNGYYNFMLFYIYNSNRYFWCRNRKL